MPVCACRLIVRGESIVRRASSAVVTCQDLPLCSANQASINLDEDIEHPAMFPEELIEPFVKATTGKGDLVLDIFAGSGTTGAVALDLGRRFVGYEINGDFCKLSQQRLEIL